MRHERKPLTNRLGFTVVELLVVITIIGIISSLLIISYTIYRKNAENTQTATTAQSYINALNLYRLENNNYPTFPEGYACLGEGYDLAGDGTKKCQISPGTPPYVQEITSFNNALRPYFPGDKLPKPGTFILNILPTWKATGGFYMGDVPAVTQTLDGVRYPWFINYFLQGGDTKCPVGPVATLTVNGTPQQYSSAPPATGYTYSWGTVVQCSVPLPAIAATP